MMGGELCAESAILRGSIGEVHRSADERPQIERTVRCRDANLGDPDS